ncbi:MAG: hypothetical protein V1748_01990 [Actinomycetota bacterium]
MTRPGRDASAASTPSRITRWGIGGVPVEPSTALTASVWALVTIGVLGNVSMLPVSAYFKRHLNDLGFVKDWVALNEIPPLGDMAGMAAVFIAMALAIGFGFAMFHGGIPGGRISKGLAFGAALWVVGVVPFELIDIQVSKVPAMVILLLWIGLWLPVSLAIGLVVSFLYPRRTRPSGGKSAIVPGTFAQSWKGLGRKLWAGKLTIVLSAGIATAAAAVVGVPVLLLYSPMSRMPRLLRPALVEGRYSPALVVGVGAVVFAWALVISLFYAAVEERSPFGGAAGGAFFGAWLYAMMGLPMMLVLFPVSEFPSAVILVDLVFLPLVLHVGAGTVYGALMARVTRPGQGAVSMKGHDR